LPTFGERNFIIAAAVLVFACFPATALQSQKQELPRTMHRPVPTSEPVGEGRRFFENRCAGCHGIDGRGGERAPDIATDQKVQHRTDSALAQIVHNGIPSAGMPAFSTLNAVTMRSLLRYLRFLQGKTGSAALPGNPQHGKQLFFGKARCSACHLAEGQGGFIAADLSSYGRRRPVEEIRDAIIKPGQDWNPKQNTVSVITQDGQTVSGVVRNEDNFSLQLQSLDGAFHLIMKSDVAGLTRASTSLMPADYGSTLGPSELNDLISFLMSLARKDKLDSDSKIKPGWSDD
jgi:cytochrome c oxidase cbb3-type subunit III